MVFFWPAWVAGSVVIIAGIVGLLLTFFGLVTGFRVITPILFGAGATLYLIALGLRQPFGILGAAVGFSIFFELVVYFNWLNLGGVL